MPRLTDRIQEWKLEEGEKEYLASARTFLEEGLREKQIFLNDIKVFDRLLLLIGQLYENLVTSRNYNFEE